MNITSFGKALQIKSSTIYRWYKNVLSDYAKEPEIVHKYDVKNKKSGKTIEVPILKQENFGEKMALDEKHIGDDICTVLTNRENGKIALLLKSMNFSDIQTIADQHKPLFAQVKSITRDFSSLFEKVCTELLPQATQIGDKFHVIRNLMDAHQSVRIRFRQKELEKRRKAFHKYKQQEIVRLQECEMTGKEFKVRKFHYKEDKFSNGESALEILSRSRYLLFKYPHQWNVKQKTRAMLLFQAFPQIQKAYFLCNEFRTIMSKENIGKHYIEIDKQIHQWYEDVDDADIDEISNFKSMIETNEEIVKNYFLSGETNAIAENVNSKIQKLITSNRGNRDKDFFYFRIGLYFA